MTWRRGLAAVGFAALGAGACGIDYGLLPATCAEGGQCPDGYVCIQAVCAREGTLVPIRVAEIGNLRGGDLRIVPERDSALVVWESYPYNDPLGEAVLARRVHPDGSASETFVLVDSTEFAADTGAVEPYYDLVLTEEGRALVALSASPISQTDPRPRLRVFSVELPAGDGADEVKSAPAWDAEVRMSTIGYGNVSQPRFARVSKDGPVLLGYFEGVVTEDATFGRLEVFEMDADGVLLDAPQVCPLSDPECCASATCIESARTEAVAAPVAAVQASPSAVAWTIDDVRPSCIVITSDAAPPREVALEALAVPLAADASQIVYVIPSERAGDGLPESPVEGGASLMMRAVDAPSSTLVASLPVVRDTPRPAWVARDEGRGLLVTPGADIDSPDLHVYDVDLATGAANEVATIARLSSLELGGVQATIASDRLYVAWLDVGEEGAVIRALVLGVPP